MALFEEKAPSIMIGLMRDLAPLQDFQAGGILGNLGWECGGFEELTQLGGGGGRGWPQWDGSRRDAFFAWCAKKGLDWKSDEANYGYLVLELTTSERASLVALRATTSLGMASDTFEATFERAGRPALAGRRAFAARAMSAYHSSATTGTSPPAPPTQTPTPPAAPVPPPQKPPVAPPGTTQGPASMFNIGSLISLISSAPSIIEGVMKIITEVEAGYAKGKAAGGDPVVIFEDILAALVANKGAVAAAVLGPEPSVTAAGAIVAAPKVSVK